jgi:peptide/nickel transport system permease protein
VTRVPRAFGILLAVLLAALAITAPWLTAHAPSDQFSDFVYAPPMPPRLFDAAGNLRAPFVYPLRLENRLERRYTEERDRPVPLRFFSGGRLISVDPAFDAPWFPLGTDALGRDGLTRLAWGTRVSLGVAIVAALGALIIGAVVGGLAGSSPPAMDDGLMRVSDFVMALPAIYVVLALRASMPVALTTPQVFWTVAVVLAAVGWPLPARGVRAIVASERTREYAEAARAMGAGRTRILLRHLLPATRGFLVVQTTLLLPAFVLAEATLSFVGLGFDEPVASWGRMLRDAAAGRALVEAPWLFAPAVAIVVSTLAVNLVFAGGSARVPGTSASLTP